MKKIFIITLLVMYSFILRCMESAPQTSIVYAPWRADYLKHVFKPAQTTSTNPEKPCVFCRILNTSDDKKEFILHRAQHNVIMLAIQPYTNDGVHFLIVPYEHTREVCNLSRETYAEANRLTRQLCQLMYPFCNETWININQGIAASASVPTHHHKHIIAHYKPRGFNLVHAIKEAKITVDLSSIFEEMSPLMQHLHEKDIQESLHQHLYADCYKCCIIKNDTPEENKKNLIIHRGKHITAMLSHHPSYDGEIDLVPNYHIQSLSYMPVEMYEELNTLTRELYPLVLDIMNIPDSNIGLISYDNLSKEIKHLTQKFIPRSNNPQPSPIMQANHLNYDAEKLYAQIIDAWKKRK